MQQSNRPAKILAPFAQGDTGRAEVPLNTADSTRASQTLGFPPLTGTPPEAGGVPPQREDMNGAMNQIARGPWWSMLGGRFPFDAAFAGDAAINGYPSAALLPAADGLGDWLSTADNNTANPDTTATGWAPGYHYGSTVLVGQVGGTFTATPAQAAKRLLAISGTLTSNLVVIVPAWVYSWDVINNTGGPFTVTVRTASGGGAVIPQNGQPTRIVGDGTDVVISSQTVPAATNILAGIQRNATNAEAAAGSLTNATVTPAALSSAALLKNANLAGLTDVAAARLNLGLGAVAQLSEIQISNVTGLATSLAAKANLTGATFTGAVTINNAVDFGVGFIVANQGNGPNSASGYYFGNDLDSNFAAYIAKNSSGVPGAASWWRFVNGQNTPITFTISGVGDRIRMDGTGVTTYGLLVSTGGFQDGSSRTIKHHRADLDPLDSLAAVLALRGVRYAYHWAPEVSRLGYFAEPTAEIIPEAVTEGGPDSVSPLFIEDTQMLPHHTGAIQALYAMITALQAKVADLEANR